MTDRECERPARCGMCPACQEAKAAREARRCHSRFAVIEGTHWPDCVSIRVVGCLQPLPHETHDDGLGHTWTDAEAEAALVSSPAKESK